MSGMQIGDGRCVAPQDAARERGVVAVRFRGRRVGLYRVKQFGEVGLLLNHGGISFPVGTQLDVGDFADPKSDVRPAWVEATVVGNSPGGLMLAWRVRTQRVVA